MQLEAQQAHKLAVRVMSAIGHDATEAGLIADHLIDCEPRGQSPATTRCACRSTVRGRIAGAGSPTTASRFPICCSTS